MSLSLSLSLSTSLPRLFVLGALWALATTASWADSFTSSASSAGSKSVGSLSDSVSASSKSSSGDTKAAQGPYRIEQVAVAPGKPGHLRLHLQATDTAAALPTLQLDLPRDTVVSQDLRAQTVIELRQRPYGIELALATARTGFYLLLADHWRHDMESRALTL
jgi:hypothetical protein